MVEVYAILIKNNRLAFEDVPTKLQEAVRARLYALGYDTKGVRTV